MEYKFTEIFDIPSLTRLCESFTAINGVVTALLDLDGKVHVATGWQDSCTKFHRINPETAGRCHESDTALASDLGAGKSYNVYRCKNGLVDVAVPVMVDGEHVGNFFTGQFFFEKPDMQYFSDQAEQFNFDKADYLDAINRVPTFKEDDIKRVMKFLVELTQIIGEMGKKKLDQLRQEESSRIKLEQLVEERTLELHHALNSAEKANEAKTYFLANMSHEIRTPLNAIIGFNRIIRDTEKQSDSSITEYLNHIDVSAQHLKEIVGNILDLSKIEEGRMTPDFTNLDIHALFKGIYHTNKSRAAENKLDFTFSISKEVPQWILSDRTFLNQILMNLVSNAIKFTGEGKSIQMNLQMKEGKLLFLVEDTGIGLDEEQLQRVFLPFEQADNSTRRDFGGTGLGLAITKKLCETLGGSLNAKSVKGKGSCFTALVPITEGKKQNLEITSHSFRKDISILAVDDNKINLKLLGTVLSSMGLNHKLYSDPQEAMVGIMDHHPDLLLLDLHMPGMNGFELYEAIPKSSRPVSFLLSADAFENVKQKSRELGIEDFISKPLDLDEFKLALARYFPVQHHHR